VDNATIHQTMWGGVPISDGVDFGQVIIKRTYAGDTNMDGQVNDRDFLNILANMGSVGQWLDGDLNHSGQVTADDLAAAIYVNIVLFLMTKPAIDLVSSWFFKP